MTIKNKNLLIIPITIFGFFAISNLTFASDSIKCPKGYICLKTDDPLIMASTSPCFAQAGEIFVYKIKIPEQDNNISKGDSVSLTLQSQNQDHAGVWDVFKPGVSSFGRKEDWGWKTNIFLTHAKTIQSITVINDDGSEGWSTSKDDRLFGKQPYPLVVINESGSQLNSSYDQTFKMSEGTTTLNLFGQMETPSVSNPEIVIIFTDHTYVSTSEIKPYDDGQDVTPIIPDNSLWDRLKGLFGF